MGIAQRRSHVDDTSNQLDFHMVRVLLVPAMKLGLLHPVAVVEQRHRVFHRLSDVGKDGHGFFFLPKRFSNSLSVRPICFSNSFSVRTGTPSPRALSSLLPASSPTTTRLVFFETLLPGLPP